MLCYIVVGFLHTIIFLHVIFFFFFFEGEAMVYTEMPLFRIYSEFRIFQFSIKSLRIFLHFDQKSVFLYKLYKLQILF